MHPLWHAVPFLGCGIIAVCAAIELAYDVRDGRMLSPGQIGLYGLSLAVTIGGAAISLAAALEGTLARGGL